ncbi:MAG: ABC transporter substrate-binding protein [Chloroflexota bacterium]
MATNRTRGLIALTGVAALGVATLAPVAQAQDPITMQMWGRNVDEVVYNALIEEWNATHVNQIELTIIPSADYVARVAAAASAGELPDLLDVDLIYMPDFIEQGLFQPITDKVNGYANKDSLSPGHVSVSTTADGQIYGVPFYVDASSLFWNKDLYAQAGLDPEQGPTSWAEVQEHARAIRALGPDTYGFYFAGACAGCNAYTYLPQIWAAGGDVIDYANHTATIGTDPIVREAFAYYKTMWDEGLIPEGAKAEDGSTWMTTFASGNIGIQPLGGGWGIRGVAANNPDLSFGVTALPGRESGQTASFAGGDTIAVSSSAQSVDAAWEFIEWTLSDDVQIEIYAKNGAFTSRTDLADNAYAAADPRLVANNQALINGDTPNTLGYNEIFNDKNGPWIASIQTAILGGDLDGGLSSANAAIDAILDQYYP